MPFRLRTLAAIVAFGLAGCGGAERVFLTTTPRMDMGADHTIAVVPDFADPHGVRTRLEELLLRNGFRVVSESLKQTTVTYKDRTSPAPEGTPQEATVEKVTEIRSDYLLRFDYAVDAGKGWGGSEDEFARFAVKVVNRATGEIVGIGQYARDGDHTIDEVLAGVVADLRKGLAKPVPDVVPAEPEEAVVAPGT